MISDTFGRPWRRGVVNIAIGCAGIGGILDLRGFPDSFGRELLATEICVADRSRRRQSWSWEDAAGPCGSVRGIDRTLAADRLGLLEVVRPPSEDLFR